MPTVAVVLSLVLVLQASPTAFWLVKGVGAAYLLWLGYQALRAHNLISFERAQQLPLWRVLSTGLLSTVLNPKSGLFVMAFIPQFTSPERGSVGLQMLGYGALFAVLTALIFALLACFAAQLSAWFAQRPRVVLAANVGAGLTFISAGFSILLLDTRSKA